MCFSANSTYNYLGCHVSELILAFEKGDLIQARTIQVLSILLLIPASLLIICINVK